MRTLKEFGNLLGIPMENLAPIHKVQADSRNICPGDLFFALPGLKTTGESFLNEVAEKGAIGAVVSQDYKGETFGLELLRVNSVLKSLQTLAREVFLEKKRRVIGVTGSVGKTTTKEFIFHLLDPYFNVGKTPMNHNSQIGLPLSLLNMEEDKDVLVLEMGMTAFGEIRNLVKIAPPEVVVVTKIGHAHIGALGGLEGVAKAKGEILESSSLKHALLAMQVRSFSPFKETPAVTYGEEGDLFLYFRGAEIQIRGKEESPFFTPPFYEKHLLENLLAAVSVARYFKLDWEAILAQISTLQIPERRFEKIEKKGVFFLNDSYNASLEAIFAALEHLPSAQKGKKKIAVLGAMVELGEHSEACHTKVAEKALPHFDQFFCLGEKCAPMKDVLGGKARFYEDIHLLSKDLFQMLEAGDVVFIKGASVHALWRLVEWFDFSLFRY